MKSFDVAIAGAGVFGAWTAFLLARSGAKVLLVDAHGAGNSRASSGGETRIMRMSYGADEIYTRSAIRSLKLWKQFFPDVFQRTGVLVTSPRDDPYLHSTRETLGRVRYKFEWLDSNALSARFPSIALNKNSAGIYEPQSGVLLARRAVREVVGAAVEAGARFEIGRITPERLPKAGAIVFACGPWLPSIFPELLGRRIRPTRQPVFFFGNREPFDVPAWVAFREGVYALPPVEGRGFKLAIDEHGSAFDPENGERKVSAAEIQKIRAVLARRFPALADAPLLESRVCQYENTSNGDFLIDRHPQLANVWIAGGGSGHGFKHGPFVGEYIAARLAGKPREEPRFLLASKDVRQNRAVY
ncbi:MAG TPA: FAD-dependent oxidoreductase [Bryobacteraceae bacterium]|nr:FAD-dependent oxidoreductase [Bryobacteraceae bacterium]